MAILSEDLNVIWSWSKIVGPDTEKHVHVRFRNIERYQRNIT